MKTCILLCFGSLLATTLHAETGYVSPWEISVTAGVRQFDLHLDTKPTASFHKTPLSSSEEETAVFPGIELRRVMSQSDSMIVRLDIGYNFAKADWDSGEHEAGEAPGEIYALDISRFYLNAHQFTAMVDVSWKVGDAWEAGLRVGPTLNLFDGEFKGSHETFQENESGSDGKFLTGHVKTDSGTKAAIGVTGEAFVRYTPPGSKLFLEARAGYGWTDNVSYGDSAIRAKLDGTSWVAGVSVGWKF